jgi:hypothetical protein
MNCPRCFSAMTGVQYRGTSQDYDGVSEWSCDRCATRIGRWTKCELLPDQIEPRYGAGGEPKFKGDRCLTS